MKLLSLSLTKVLVIATVSITVAVMAGETKNNVIYDCNKPADVAVTCLACNIYHEARSESHPGLWMVALATKNRVDGKLYPTTKAGPKVVKEKLTDPFCKVVYEQRFDKKRKKWTPMFSWTLDGKHDRVYNPGNWYDSLELATKLVNAHEGKTDKVVDITFGCQWYHHVSIQPYWMKAYHPTVRIGAHQCYSQNETAYIERLNNVLPKLGALRATKKAQADEAKADAKELAKAESK